jgi:hypothetical protein
MLVLTQLIKEFHVIYGTQSFIILFTRTTHLSLSWARRTQILYTVYISFWFLIYMYICCNVPSSKECRYIYPCAKASSAGNLKVNSPGIVRFRLSGTEQSAWSFVCFTPDKLAPWINYIWVLVDPIYGVNVTVRRGIHDPTGIQTQAVQTSASYFTDWCIPAHNAHYK